MGQKQEQFDSVVSNEIFKRADGGISQAFTLYHSHGVGGSRPYKVVCMYPVVHTDGKTYEGVAIARFAEFDDALAVWQLAIQRPDLGELVCKELDEQLT